MTHIDRGLEAPVYQQIAAVIRARIEAGQYPPGRAIPSAPALAAEFGVARMTVVRALRLLANDSLVRTHARRGTYVTGEHEPAPAAPAPVALTGPGIVTRLTVLALPASGWLVALAATVLLAFDPW
jgi:DNA-binding transcriptional regulator YhcF (GntR family)